jgi:hypothetical protein
MRARMEETFEALWLTDDLETTETFDPKALPPSTIRARFGYKR